MFNTHKLLRISSRDRNNLADSTSNFYVNVNNVKPLQIAKAVIVKQVTLPNTMYNIDENNRSFTYNIASSPTTVQIAVGQYNTTTLISALQTAASAVGLAITQNATTLKLEFTNTTNIEYLDISENPMAEVLGIEYGQGSGSDVASFNATGLPDLAGIKNVFVESQALGEDNLIQSNSKTKNIIAIIPIDTAFGGYQQYLTPHAEIDDNDNRTHGGHNKQTIDITLRDSRNNIIDLNGHHIEIVLKIYY